MLFFYYDLPMVEPSSDDQKSEHPNGYDYSVNGSIEPGASINATRVERSYDSTISNNTINDDLTSSGAVIDGEKQKLVNINAAGLHRHPRKASVTEKWHLAKGRLETPLNSKMLCCINSTLSNFM